MNNQPPEESTDPRVVEDLYMCKTDFDYELGNASGGCKVYPSEEDLRRDRRCVAQCGIVKVKVTLVQVVQEEKYSDL